MVNPRTDKSMQNGGKDGDRHRFTVRYEAPLNRRKICRQVATPPQSSQEPLQSPSEICSQRLQAPTKPVRRIAARQPLSLWQPDEAVVDGDHVTSKFVGQRWKRHRRGVGRIERDVERDPDCKAKGGGK